MPAGNPDATPSGARRIALWSGLGGLIALSWAYLLYQAWAMVHMDIVDMAMPSMDAWHGSDLLLVFVMWAIMMVAMMLPSALPAILLFASVQRQRSGRPAVQLLHVWLFVGGYLLVWTAFSALATLGQWGLHAVLLLSPVLTATSRALGGALLLGAGVYQWTPFKAACLAHCRSPLQFLLTGWRNGKLGALRMGVTHGAYCAGCCWLLMTLLFVVGVMNVQWIAALSAAVLIEKVFPRGLWLARGIGLGLIVWGVWMLLPGSPSLLVSGCVLPQVSRKRRPSTAGRSCGQW